MFCFCKIKSDIENVSANNNKIYFGLSLPRQVLAVGGRRLLRLHWAHRFDLIILVTRLASYLVVGVPGNTRALYVDHHPMLSDVIELPIAIAVFRCDSVVYLPSAAIATC